MQSSLTMECNGIDKRFSVCEVVKNFIGSGPSTVGPFPLVAHPRTVSEGTPLRGYPPFGRWSPPADVACHSVIIYVCIFCLRSLPSVDTRPPIPRLWDSLVRLFCVTSQHMCNQIQPYFAASSSALRNMNERIHLQKSSCHIWTSL